MGTVSTDTVHVARSTRTGTYGTCVHTCTCMYYVVLVGTTSVVLLYYYTVHVVHVVHVGMNPRFGQNR